MNKNMIIILGISMLITMVHGSKVKSERYIQCLTNSCNTFLKDPQSSKFFDCAKNNGTCMISNVFSISYNNEFNTQNEKLCIESCSVQDSQDIKYNQFIKQFKQCSLTCLNDTYKSEDSSMSFNLPVFIITIGVIFGLIFVYLIYVCIRRNKKISQKFEWQIQQENNLRNQQERERENNADNNVYPTPLTQIPESDFYKTVTHPSQLRARKINDDFAKYLFQSAYQKLYGDQVGIPGVIQYGIPLYAFPCIKEQNDIKIQEAEIIIPDNKDQVCINIEALQANQIQIQSKQQEQDFEEADKEMYVINMDAIQQQQSESKKTEELVCQAIQIKKSASSRGDQKQQTCLFVRKQSANISRSNKIQNQVQQNMRRQTCF